MIKIQPASAKDTELIAGIGAQSFQETFDSIFTPEDMRLYLLDTYNPEKITKEILDPNSKFYLAYYNNEAAGYMKLSNSPVPGTLIEKFTSSIELQKLYLLKEYHSLSIGKELMKTCIHYTKEKGYDSVWLCVLQENLKAVKFYENWGFRVFGSKNITVGLVNKEHSLMVKQI